MKVLILTQYLQLGGINRYCLYLTQGLRRLGIEAHLMSPTHPTDGDHPWLLETAPDYGIDVRILNMRSKFDLSAIWELRQILHQEKFDILQTNGFRSNVIGRLATRFMRAPLKSVATVHALPHNVINSWHVRLDMLTTNFTHQFIAVDHQSIIDFDEHSFHKRPITLIHNGIEIPDLSPSPHDDMRQQMNVDFIVGFVGRVSEQKGVEYFLALMERLLLQYNNVGFVIVGEGSLSHLIEPYLKGKDKARIRWIGQVQDVSPYYRMIDCIVMPSIFEGLPFVSIEAMSYGIPVIASAVGGLREAIVDSETGYLVEVGDVDTLFQRVSSLMEDAELRATLSQAARQRAIEHFSVDTMSQKHVELYQKLLTRKDQNLADRT